MSITAINALRERLQSPSPRPAPYVRPLMDRSISFIAMTITLAAEIGCMVVDAQKQHYVHQNVEWAMAIFDVQPASGGAAVRSANAIGTAVNTRIVRAVGDGEITDKVAMEAVYAELVATYGQRVSVKNWLPGHTVAEGDNVIYLSGKPCPKCTKNPTGLRPDSDDDLLHCLNKADCGWSGR